MTIFEIAIIFLAAEIGRSDAAGDALVARSVADWFDATCVVFLRSDDLAPKRIQDLKIMFEGMKAATVRKFRPETIRYRYDGGRCSRTMHVLDGRPDGVRLGLSQVSHTENLGGQIWLVFLSETVIAEEYFRDSYIPFDSNFIAVQSGTSRILRQVYRVSMDHGIRTAPFGNWTREDGLTIHGDYSPTWHRSDLEGRTFRVSAIERWPLVTLTEGDVFGGYFGRVWKELEERLNFSSIYVKPKEFVTGFSNKGKWKGLIGMISEGEIDAAISEVTMTPERLSEVDFLKPLYSTRYQLFFKSPGMIIHWDLILRPFQTEVWLTLLLWMGVLTFLLHAGHRIGLRYGLEDPKRRTEYDCYNCFFFVASSFSQQANATLPKSGFCRLVLATSYMFSTVVTIIYSCNLMSIIAVQEPSRPFDSLESFLKDGTYTLQQIPGTDAYAYFSNSTDPVLRTIYRTQFSNLPEEELPTSHRMALDRVCGNEKIAHLGEFGLAVLAVNELRERKGCRFIFLERQLKLLYLSMAVTKDSPYRDAFDYQIDQMAVSGILNHFRMISFPLWGRTRDVTFQPVTIEQTAQMNLILIWGLVAAISAFLGEFFLKRKRD